MRAHVESGQRSVFSYGWADSQAREIEIDFKDISRLKKAVDAALGGGLIDIGTFIRAPSHSTDEVFRLEYKKARELDLLISIDGGTG
jgi:hypothetical protein